MHLSFNLVFTVVAIIWTPLIYADGYGSRNQVTKYASFENRVANTAISDSNLMPVLTNMTIKCARAGFNVFIEFSTPFSGIIYSKGHFRSEGCRYVTKANNGKAKYSFVIPTDDCGTINQMQNRPGKEMFAANTIIIQNDPLIQEIWDQAKTLRCIWRTSFTKSIKFNGFKVAKPLAATVQLSDEMFRSQTPLLVGQMPSGEAIQGYVTNSRNAPSINILFENPTSNYDVDIGQCIGEDSGKTVDMTTKSGCNLVPNLWEPFRKLRDDKGNILLFSYLTNLELTPKLRITCKITICQNKCVSLCDDPPPAPSPLR